MVASSSRSRAPSPGSAMIASRTPTISRCMVATGMYPRRRDRVPDSSSRTRSSSTTLAGSGNPLPSSQYEIVLWLKPRALASSRCDKPRSRRARCSARWKARLCSSVALIPRGSLRGACGVPSGVSPIHRMRRSRPGVGGVDEVLDIRTNILPLLATANETGHANGSDERGIVVVTGT